jgi:hypothetical protein
MEEPIGPRDAHFTLQQSSILFGSKPVKQPQLGHQDTKWPIITTQMALLPMHFTAFPGFLENLQPHNRKQHHQSFRRHKSLKFF